METRPNICFYSAVKISRPISEESEQALTDNFKDFQMA
jgi:hypothetical protein